MLCCPAHQLLAALPLSPPLFAGPLPPLRRGIRQRRQVQHAGQVPSSFIGASSGSDEAGSGSGDGGEAYSGDEGSQGDDGGEAFSGDEGSQGDDSYSD